MSNKSEKTIKFLFIGDAKTGKTSIIKRYVHDLFSENYHITTTVDFGLKILAIGDVTYRLQLWDIAGQDRYQNISRVYYRGAFGAFIVYDSTCDNSFESIKKWKTELDSKVTLPNGKPLPVLLLANKCDLSESKTNPDELDQFVKDNGFIGWEKTSAKLNINLESSVKELLNVVISHSDLWEDEKDDSAIPLSSISPSIDRDRCC
ncbi:hypothetical protein WA158_008032 [Blastocystis sp. Blastoise]